MCIYACVDGSSDVRSRPGFHLLVESFKPFHLVSFRFRCAADSVGKTVSQSSKDYLKPNSVAYIVDPDFPNIMIKARRLATCEEQGGSNVSIFAYGCCCHSLYLIINDFIKLLLFRATFKMSITLTLLFKKTHIAGSLLKQNEKN